MNDTIIILGCAGAYAGVPCVVSFLVAARQTCMPAGARGGLSDAFAL